MTADELESAPSAAHCILCRLLDVAPQLTARSADVILSRALTVESSRLYAHLARLDA